MRLIILLVFCCAAAPAFAQTPAAPLQFGAKPDPKFFEANVQPLFRDVCSTCHAGSGNAAGRFTMQQSFGSPYTDEQTQRNFEEAVKRIRFKDPNNSLLINKPTAKVTHGGGQQMREGGKDHKNFIDWINGAIHVGPVGGGGGAALDLAFFEAKVSAILDKTCAVRACHGGTVGAGAVFHLEPSVGGRMAPDVLKANFEQAAKKVKPKDPAASSLVRKPGGEVPHGGGIQLEKTSPEYVAIVEWINGGRLGGPGGLDRAFFDQFVNPLIGRTCGVATCHGGKDGIGARFHLHPPGPGGRFETKQLDDNFTAITNPALPRAKAGDPDGSLMVMKPSGAAPHGGGIKLPKGSEGYNIVVRWIRGEKARPNRPPIIALEGPNEVLEQRLGSPATIDVSATRDPESDAVTYNYQVSMAPRGAVVEVKGSGARATLTVNRPGAYVVTVVASDGKPGGESEPYKVTVIVTGESPPEDPSMIGARTIAPATASLPAGRHEVFVRRVYFDVLGRGPTPEEHATALNLPRERLVSTLFNRPEYHRSWLEEQFLYFGLSGPYRFAADLVANASLGLFNREYSQPQILFGLVTSKPYVDRNFGTVNPQNFFAIAFEQLVGRGPTDAELRAAGMDLIRNVMTSPEFYARYVQRVYRRYVGVDCPPELAKKISDRLVQFPSASMAVEQEIVLSADYLNALARPKSKTPAMLADSLIRDVLGRAPNDSEFDAARTALAGSQDHAAVALLIGRALLGSSEAKTPSKSAVSDRNQWVRDQFLRFLRREPSAKELSAFADAMSESQVTPRLIIEALISAAEYTIY